LGHFLTNGASKFFYFFTNRLKSKIGKPLENSAGTWDQQADNFPRKMLHSHPTFHTQIPTP
jgi:hypothetical protein